ncbi:MAG: transposase [Rubrivivax sp.]
MRLERLVRYVARPALANERIEYDEGAGCVTIELKSPWRDGTTHLAMTPLEFMQRLAALVPRPRLHLIRFHGVLAPNAKLRPLVVPMGPPAPRTAIGAEDDPFEAAPEPKRRNYIPWAKLLARVFKLDLEHCPHCGGGLRMVAAILERDAIERILAVCSSERMVQGRTCDSPAAWASRIDIIGSPKCKSLSSSGG